MRCIVPVLLAVACGTSTPKAAQPVDPKDPPETVLATYRAKPGKEAELERVIEEHWAALRTRDLVASTPHLLFRGEDEPGKTMFVNILTWRRQSIPDQAPAEIQAIWAKMAPLVEERGGHRAIEFPEIHEIQLPE